MTIVDGSGAAGFVADVAVAEGRIAAVGVSLDRDAVAVIDGAGRVLAPGFIDVHTHDDRAALAAETILPKVSQGVTTVVVGNCGISLAPLTLRDAPPKPLDLIGDRADYRYPTFAAYLDALDREPPAVNAVAQVGHSTLRAGAMDRLDRPATSTEIKAMRGKLEESLEAGAIGLSTGLFYPPANAAPTEEIVELAKALSGRGAMHTTHMRDEADGIVDSLTETFRIGREAGAPVVISHHKCAGAPNHGRSVETLKLIDEARKRQPLGLDAYPYVAGSTVLDARRTMGASRIVITWSKGMPEAKGRDLAELAKEHGLAMEAMADRLQPAGAIYFMMDEADVRRILAYPHTMIGSDGLPHDEHPHPRLWGTFPRVLGHYARDEKLFPLEQAVRKMTGLSAAQFGLTDRGVLREGAYADLVLFDPATIVDAATFDAPMTPSPGVLQVWVNGRAVWKDGAPTGSRPGRALRLQDLGPKGGIC